MAKSREIVCVRKGADGVASVARHDAERTELYEDGCDDVYAAEIACCCRGVTFWQALGLVEGVISPKADCHPLTSARGASAGRLLLID